METICYANNQYSRKECLEISGIPASFADDRLESKVLEILQENEVSIDPSLFEDCHQVCACTARNWSPNVKCFGLLLAFLRFESAKDCRESSY